MKTKFFLAAVIVLVSTAAYSNGPGSPRLVVIHQKSPGIFKVIYEGLNLDNVKMTILNMKDEIVFAETTRKVNGFVRSVNFTRMEPGEYTIEISDKTGKQIQKVLYAEEPSVNNVRVSKVAVKKYLLSVSNEGSQEINVRIFDGANNLVHDENRKINGNFGLVYDLKAINGAPRFEVTDKTGTIHEVKY